MPMVQPKLDYSNDSEQVENQKSEVRNEFNEPLPDVSLMFVTLRNIRVSISPLC